VDRLQPQERALCEHLRLQPAQYQQVKAAIVSLSLARGHVRRGEARDRLVHVEAAKVGGVFDFVVQAGWAVARVAAGDEAGDVA